MNQIGVVLTNISQLIIFNGCTQCPLFLYTSIIMRESYMGVALLKLKSTVQQAPAWEVA